MAATINGGMEDVDFESVGSFVRLAGIPENDVQREMASYGAESGFPIIGPEAGGVLRVLTRLVDPTLVFEFGSGFGYSASWFVDGLGPDGRLVLTEYDGSELDQARSFLGDLGVLDRVSFEEGDALEIADRYDGPFDMVLLDHEKTRYVEAFETIRGKVPTGGVVIADNVMAGPISFESVLDGLAGSTRAIDETSRAIVEYLEHTRDDGAFDSVVVPVGNGLSVSVKRSA